MANVENVCKFFYIPTRCKFCIHGWKWKTINYGYEIKKKIKRLGTFVKKFFALL